MPQKGTKGQKHLHKNGKIITLDATHILYGLLSTNPLPRHHHNPPSHLFSSVDQPLWQTGGCSGGQGVTPPGRPCGHLVEEGHRPRARLHHQLWTDGGDQLGGRQERRQSVDVCGTRGHVDSGHGGPAGPSEPRRVEQRPSSASVPAAELIHYQQRALRALPEGGTELAELGEEGGAAAAAGRRVSASSGQRRRGDGQQRALHPQPGRLGRHE